MPSAPPPSSSLPTPQAQFLAKMSHELRTPLNSVLGLIELASRRPVDELTRYYLRRCLESSQHLRALIDDILDFSKLEAGRLDLKPARCDLKSVLRQAVVALPASPHAEKVALNLEVAGSPLPDQVWVDALRLAQILINLVSNALKFTTQGSVTLRLIGLGWEGAGQETRCRCRFEVEDTGPGIPESLLPRLYRLYEQGHEGTGQASTGTGLGLAISRQLAQAMGTDLEVKTVPGQGTLFSVELDLPCQPLTGASPWTPGIFDLEKALGLEAPDTPASTPLESPDLANQALSTDQFSGPVDRSRCSTELAGATTLSGSLRGKRLLVIDDNENNRMVARGLLEEAGAQVEFAENGLVGVERLAQMAQGASAIDLVLLDWHMPVMDGLQVVQHIRKAMGLADLPVLAMTANVSEEDRQTCLLAGMNDHLSKPLSSSRLIQTILKWSPPPSLPRPSSAPSESSFSAELPEGVFADADVPQRWLELADQADVDLLGGLHRLNARADLYAQSLAAELQSWPLARKRFLEALGDRNTPELNRLLHAQKGVFGTLGFQALTRKVVAVEARLKSRTRAWAEDPVMAAAIDAEVRALLALMDQMEKPLTTLLDTLRAAIRERHAHRLESLEGARLAIDPKTGALWQRLHTLARRMSRFEMDAVSLMNDLEEDLQRVLPPPTFAELQRHMGQLDFAAAQAIVDQAVRTAQSNPPAPVHAVSGH